MSGPPRVAAVAAALALALASAGVAGAGWASSAGAGLQTIAAGSLAPPDSLSGSVSCVPLTSILVTVSWPAAANATAYEVQRATTAGGPYTTIGLATVTSFVDTTVSQLTAYHYIVVAKRSDWTSGPSQQASVTTPRQSNCK